MLVTVCSLIEFPCDVNDIRDDTEEENCRDNLLKFFDVLDPPPGVKV